MFKKSSLIVNYLSKYTISCNTHHLATVSKLNTEESLGKRIQIQGWVRALRKMKDTIFLDVNDGTSSHHFQIVINKKDFPTNLTYGCSIKAEGEISKGFNGNLELKTENLKVIGECPLENYPFAPRKKYSNEYVRQYLHYRPRTRTFSSIMRLRDLADFTIREHFKSRDFIFVNTPILTSNDCEGAGETFVVEPNSNTLINEMKKDNKDDSKIAYFDKKTYMSVSGQLHLEACARALSKVYNFNPTFRAENSKSRLHLSEFYMIEAEVAFMSSIKELATEIELLLKNVTLKIMQSGCDDLKTVEAPNPTWLDKDFGFLNYDEAVNILENHFDKLTVPIKYGNSLSKEHELFLVKHNSNVPIFIVEWPKAIKPFYMKECGSNDSKVLSLDLLAPIVGEIVGGSVREDNYSKLEKKLPKNINLDWYLELRKFGNVPTAGFGMGFERYLQLLLGMENIKDVIPFPRWPHSCNL